MSAPSAHSAKLTLGPILFNWPAGRRRDFYFRIADEAPIDTVYLSEVVCAKRSPFFAADLPDIVERLERAGKEVVFSTLALVMSERELAAVGALAAESDHLLEANDASALRLLAGRRHAIGPFVNVYNEGTLGFLAGRGAVRVVLVSELPAPSLAALAGAGADVELEVQVFGRLPLALSARCYHARSRGLHKDSCQYVCAEDADGMTVETLEGQPFLAVNGTQTLSAAVCSLLGELSELKGMGISHFRLWPQTVDMAQVARLFRDVLDGRTEPPAGHERLCRLISFAPLANGYYYGREGAALVGGAGASAAE